MGRRGWRRESGAWVVSIEVDVVSFERRHRFAVRERDIATDANDTSVVVADHFLRLVCPSFALRFPFFGSPRRVGVVVGVGWWYGRRQREAV